LGTGAHADQVKLAENHRLRQLKRRRGIACRRRYRLIADKGPDIADAIFVIGDNWVRETYSRRTSARIFPICNTVVDGVVTTLDTKDFNKARKAFLWIASYAAIHRGLDVLLEVFADISDLELHICGGIEYEKDFFQFYRKQLLETRNIYFHEFVDVTSDVFTSITSQVGYVIYPSASDGMPGSVVNSMAAGLVPLLTREAGIDTGGFGKIINECNNNVIRNTVLRASAVKPETLRKEAEQVAEFARRRYSIEAYCTQFKDSMEAVLKV